MQKAETRTIPVTPPRVNAWGWVDACLRRGLDVLAAAVGLLFLGPLFGLLAVLIRRDSPGPVFYRGARAGKGGRPFGILKFRTMYEEEASYDGPAVTAQDDPRVTALGRWLRDTKLNELPQLWNVLVGEMALVGPRPEDPEIAAGWPEPQRGLLLSVRPGITSPATVVYRGEEALLSAGSVMDDYLRTILPSKLRLDSLYVRSRNLLTDLDVIFWTLVALLPQLKQLEVPHNLLYWGPLSRFVSRFLTWSVIDTLTAFAAVGLAGVLWRTSGPLNLGMDLALPAALCIGLIFSLFNALVGLNRIAWRRADSSAVVPLAFSAGLATMATLTLDRWLGLQSHLPMGMIVVSGLLAYGGFVIARYRDRLVTGLATQWLVLRGGLRSMGERVLIIGAGENSRFATWLFTHSSLAGAFTIAGLVDDDPRKEGMIVDGYPVVGGTRDIPALVEKYDAGVVVFTIEAIIAEDRQQVLALCRKKQVHVVLLPAILAGLKRQLNAAYQEVISEPLPGLRKDAELNAERNPAPPQPSGEGAGERSLPCDTVESWLEELQTLTLQNDIAAARARLAVYRERVEKKRFTTEGTEITEKNRPIKP